MPKLRKFNYTCVQLFCHHLELSKEDLEQIGVDRLSDKGESGKTLTSTSNSNSEIEPNSNSETKPKTNKTTENNIPDWERELQEELQVRVQK